MAHIIGPNLKIKRRLPDEIPDVPQKKGETAGKVTILDDKVEGREAEKQSFRTV